MSVCDKLLYSFYSQLPSNEPEKEFFTPEIEAYFEKNNIKYSVDEILARLAIRQLIEGVGKGFVRMQNKGREFCRQEKTLVQEFHEERNKKQGEYADANLKAVQWEDYERTKSMAKWALIAAIASAVLAFIALFKS